MIAIIIAPFLIWLFINYISLDFWNDEVYTLDNFVFVPVHKTVTDYHVPNNHIFFNIINNVYLNILGIKNTFQLMNEPYKIRLLMLVYSLITLVYLYLIGKKFFNSFVANLSSVILVTTVPFYNFAVQIRGYGLSTMLLTMMIYHLWSLEREFKWRDAVLVVLSATLSLYTIPLNLYFLSSVWIFYFSVGAYKLVAGKKRYITSEKQRTELILFFPQDFYNWNRHFFIAVFIGLSIVITTLLYAPVLHNVISNSYIESQGLFKIDTLIKVMPQTFKYFLSDRYLIVPITIVGLLSFVTASSKRGSQDAVYKCLFCIVLLLTPFILSFIRGDAPFCRVFVNLTPLYALFVSIGIYFFSLNFPLAGSKPFFTTLIIVLYSHFTFALALNKINTHLRLEIEQGANKSQNIYYNYYQAHYHPSKLLNDLRQSYQTDIVPVFAYDIENVSIPKYLSMYQIKHHKIQNYTQIMFNSQGHAYVLTTQPYRYEKILNTYPHIHCQILNKELDYHNILLCECDITLENKSLCPSIENLQR